MRMYVVKDPLYEQFKIEPFVQHNFKIISIEHKTFPDGEEYIRFCNEVEKGTYTVILRGFPEQNANIFRGILIVDTLKDLGIEDIILVWPYLPYARQDKRFLPGEAISATTLVKTFFLLGVSKLITVDVHNENAFKQFGSSVLNVTTERLWADYIASKYHRDEVAIIAPDRGRESFVRKVSDYAGVEYYVFEKRRDPKTGKILGHSPIDQESIKTAINYIKCFIVLDDIIATGGTIANVAKWLRGEGFKGKIAVYGTHGLFLEDAANRLLLSGVDEIATTDTVSNPFVRDELSVSRLIVSKILEMMGDKNGKFE
ncbi:MAG: ribose-phosphate diphosphokinase [Crenarchaeota archaeon]|nr:ribose-phosphate diphosphokinase [Thermoproteota archaeon]